MPERKKVVMKVNELSNVDVSFISLVRNAANRSPFKILKSTEEDVNIDLKNLFAKVRKTEDEPAVAIASVIVKAEAEPAAMAKLKDLDIAVLSKEENDGFVTLVLVKDAPDTAVILKLDDNAAVTVIGVEKMFAEWSEGNDFVENITKSGFYPSLHMATDVMVTTIHNVMETVEKGESPAADVDTVIGQYNEYVSTLVKAIPTTAYKFEKLAITKADAGEEDTVVTDTGDAGDTDTDDPNGEGIVKDDDDDTDDTVVVEGIASQESLVKAVTDSVLAGLGAVVKSEVDKATQTTTDLIKADTEVTKTTIDELITRVEKTEEDVRGVVSTTSADDKVIVKDEPKVSTFDGAIQFDGFEGQ